MGIPCCMTKKCNECNTRLVTLYIRKRENKKRRFVKIEEMYCVKCKKAIIPTNWFEGDEK